MKRMSARICRAGMACILLLAAAFAVFIVTGTKFYIVLSGSMEPVIPVGSLCIVYERADYEEVCAGDIIAFQQNNGSMVTHRVISVTDRGLETKGDANDVSDGITTTEENFRGKTVLAIPYLGYTTSFFHSSLHSDEIEAGKKEESRV